MVNLLHIRHTGANNRYYHDVLQDLEEREEIRLTIKRLDEFDGSEKPDVLTYQTFPDEFLPSKFNPDLVKQKDQLFRKFSGPKIVVCSHDNGARDSYSRFADSKELPRIKTFPTKKFFDQYNVILVTSFSTDDKEVYYTDGERDIEVSCKFGKASIGKYPHKIRESVLSNLGEFPEVYLSWSPGRSAYLQEMRRTLIAIGAPGFGQYNATYQIALRCGTLLLAHCALEDIRYLPYAVLKDGRDFVSYNLFNFADQLRELLYETPREKIDKIRRSGREAYKRGYNVRRSANDFLKYLNTL